jgi:hypothetical protein
MTHYTNRETQSALIANERHPPKCKGITCCSLVRLIRHVNNRSQCIAETFRELNLVAPESVLDIS